MHPRMRSEATDFNSAQQAASSIHKDNVAASPAFLSSSERDVSAAQLHPLQL